MRRSWPAPLTDTCLPAIDVEPDQKEHQLRYAQHVVQHAKDAPPPQVLEAAPAHSHNAAGVGGAGRRQSF